MCSPGARLLPTIYCVEGMEDVAVPADEWRRCLVLVRGIKGVDTWTLRVVLSRGLVSRHAETASPLFSLVEGKYLVDDLHCAFFDNLALPWSPTPRRCRCGPCRAEQLPSM
jgi:hypothetical protein